MKLPHLLLFTIMSTLTAAHADVTLPPIFSDHAVLQKSAKVPIWGKANAGENVTITLGNAKAEAVGGTDGKWKAFLDLSQSGEGPFELIVEGKNKLTIQDVLVGEVWVCSGQSNMEWRMNLSGKDAADEISQSANPRLRQFAVAGQLTSATPQDEVPGKWQIASPATLGGFTAVGYYFGKTLAQDLKQPVGLLLTAWGGTPIEPWIPSETYQADPGFAAEAGEKLKQLNDYPQQSSNYLAALPAWQNTYGRTDATAITLPDSTGWTPVTSFDKLGEPGSVWIRRTVTISADQAGKAQPMLLRNVAGSDRVYWNGQLIGETALDKSLTAADRNYTVPANQVTAGDATLMIRLFNPTGNPAIPGPKWINATELNTGWEMKPETVLPTLTAEAKAAMPVHPGAVPMPSVVPSLIYNAMVYPLIPYGIRGVIWYQGESNAHEAPKYRKTFPLLIQGWRQAWGQGDFPFYFCQLANFGAKTNNPAESGWADLRDAQLQTTAVPNTGQAVLIDLGESGDVHPRNKADVGKRLALLALARTYDRKVVDSGPVYQSMKIEGPQIRLQFSSADGLVAQPMAASYPVASVTNETAPLVRNSPQSELEGFAICGADQKWVWADAKIEGDTVVVTSPAVPAPTAVRYGWSSNPNVNLYNRSGLPASPFQTDASK